MTKLIVAQVISSKSTGVQAICSFKDVRDRCTAPEHWRDHNHSRKSRRNLWGTKEPTHLIVETAGNIRPCCFRRVGWLSALAHIAAWGIVHEDGQYPHPSATLIHGRSNILHGVFCLAQYTGLQLTTANTEQANQRLKAPRFLFQQRHNRRRKMKLHTNIEN